MGHDYGDWIIDREATEESEGEKHKECSRCDSKITEDIEKLPPHVHNYTETAREEQLHAAKPVRSLPIPVIVGILIPRRLPEKRNLPGSGQ